ncbi:hypothetical protein [Rhizobium leguminosarum]|uniref:hypothetical protein n=1 Tax=Rhizobium leguminosarum TaxID=384 RepID=UPI003F95A3A1
MKSFETRKFQIPIWGIILIAVLALAIATGVWLFQIEDARLMGIVSGLFTGFVLFAFGLLLQVFLFQELERYRNMGVKALLDNRHDQAYYGPIVGKAKQEVFVTGASATRFIEDFLDVSSDNPILATAMRANPKLVVRLLIPDDEHLSPDALVRWGSKQGRVDGLKREFKNRFEVRRFKHEARHSFLLVDGDFIGGPVFDGDNSKYAPAVHVDGTKTFARKHREYFDALWASSDKH